MSYQNVSACIERNVGIFTFACLSFDAVIKYVLSGAHWRSVTGMSVS